MLNESDKLYLKGFLEDGRFDGLLTEIKKDLGKDILNTGMQDAELREDLYILSKAIDALKTKLQECTNYDILEGDFK